MSDREELQGGSGTRLKGSRARCARASIDGDVMIMMVLPVVNGSGQDNDEGEG